MNPNIILLTWHDAGRWFGCYGAATVGTPHVDQLAADGCRFTNMFSACAICSPSRAAIATGRYCQANGVMYLTNTVNNNRLHRDELHLARLLKERHGYHTALFGVQHECAHEHVSDVMAADERFNTDPWPHADVTADAVCAWLSARSGARQPFYAQIGLHEAHLGRFYSGEPCAHYPWTTDEQQGVAQPPYLSLSDGTHASVTVLQGLLRRADAAIGRILAALRAAGLEQNTIVVMCVDHGVGLAGAKTTCYDPGLAVACLMRYPGVIPAGTLVTALATHVDVLPTLLTLAELPVPSNVHGHSFAEHVCARAQHELRGEVFSHMVETIRSIRTRQFKLIRNFRRPHEHAQSRATLAPQRTATLAAAAHLELYDLERDPHEFHNRADDPAYAAVRIDLDARLWDFLLDYKVRWPPQCVRRPLLRYHHVSMQRGMSSAL